MSEYQVESLINKRFGYGVVLKDLGIINFGPKGKLKHPRRHFQLKCDCGNIYNVMPSNLRKTQSCGCERKRLLSESLKKRRDIFNLIGERFGKGVVIENLGKRPYGKPQNDRTLNQNFWKVKCDCGNTYEATTGNLRNKSTKSCGCLRRSQVDLLGKSFGFLKITKKLPIQGEGDDKEQYWEAECICGKILKRPTSTFRTIRSCGCRFHTFEDETAKPISIEKYFNNLKKGAEKRGLEFLIKIDDIKSLLIQQSNKCSLSKLDISLENGSASLDRINNSKGYISTNIQWLHRNINFLKHRWNQDKFIELCKLVAKNN